LSAFWVASGPEIKMVEAGKVSNVIQVDACHLDHGGILQKACTQDAFAKVKKN